MGDPEFFKNKKNLFFLKIIVNYFFVIRIIKSGIGPFSRLSRIFYHREDYIPRISIVQTNPAHFYIIQ